GAVACAQLPKLEEIVASRVGTARRLTEALAGVPGIATPRVAPGSSHVYWKYCVRVDGSVIKGGSPALGKLLKERGIASAPRYIQKPAFQCAVFRDQRTFGTSRWPFTLARPEAVDYSPERFPGTIAALEGVLVLPWNECYTNDHVNYIATSLRQTAARLL